MYSSHDIKIHRVAFLKFHGELLDEWNGFSEAEHPYLYPTPWSIPTQVGVPLSYTIAQWSIWAVIPHIGVLIERETKNMLRIQ
jgi:hypothetical protein